MLKKAAAITLALGFLSSPALAGSFRSGTDSQSSRFDSTRVSTGTDSLKATRNYQSEIKGHSNKRFESKSFSSENYRNGDRAFTFIEGDSAVNANLMTTGNGEFDISAGGGGSSTGGGGQGAIDNDGRIAGAGSLGSEIDGMTGTGNELFKDGSYDFSSERGSANVSFKQTERGGSVYRSSSNFSSVDTEDGTRSSGGSVFSIN